MAGETKKNKEKKRFFKDFRAELKKVIWPTPKQIVNNTIAVITIVIVTAIIVLVLDLAFEAINKYGINKLRSFVPESETIIENVSEEGENVGNVEESENEILETTETVEESTENIEESSETNNTVQE